MSEPVASTLPSTEKFSERRLVGYIVFGLIAAVICAYAVIVRADFIDFDDNNHVFENALVKGGLSWRGLGDAFTTFPASLWIPLTWISYMVDVSLFGLNPGEMHAVNLLWHVATTVLLFFTLRRLTGRLWASAFIAALFGLHPLNVESVAWITERKSLLSTFFWVAAIAAYARYAEKPGPRWYLATFLATALALLSKPMAVTLPCTLLLLDFWPLARFRTVGWTKLFVEKIPFFLLTAFTSWITFVAQRSHAVVSVEALPIAGRVSNALVSYVVYLGDFFWPLRLGVFYPHPVVPQVSLAIGAAMVLLAITGFAIWSRRQRPWFLMGWLWYLGTLVPVSGLLQVGAVARADRFTYVPQIGFFVAIVWLAQELGAAYPRVLRWAAGAVLAACALLTMQQVGYWLDGAALFKHTIEVTENNGTAYGLAARHLARGGETAESIPYYQTSLRLQPRQPMIWREFGAALNELGKPTEAIQAWRMALDLDPADYGARYKLGVTLFESGATEEAAAQFAQILRALPNSAGSHYYLALTLEKQGHLDDARQHLAEAARLAPQDSRISDALYRLAPRP